MKKNSKFRVFRLLQNEKKANQTITGTMKFESYTKKFKFFYSSLKKKKVKFFFEDQTFEIEFTLFFITGVKNSE